MERRLEKDIIIHNPLKMKELIMKLQQMKKESKTVMISKMN